MSTLGERSTAAAIRCQDEPDNPEAWEDLRRSMWGLMHDRTRRLKSDRSYFDRDDLMQEAWMLVARAVPKWDRGRNLKFATYAARLLGTMLFRQVAEATGPVRVPYSMQCKAQRSRCKDPQRLARSAAALTPPLRLDAGNMRHAVGLAAPEIEDRSDDDETLRAKRVVARRLEAMRVHAPRHAEALARRRLGEGEPLESIAADLGVSKGFARDLDGAALWMLRTGVIVPEGRRGGEVRVDADFTYDKGDAA